MDNLSDVYQWVVLKLQSKRKLSTDSYLNVNLYE